MVKTVRSLLILIMLILSGVVSAQYSVQNHRTADQLKEKLEGNGIEIINVEILCKDSFLGTYSGVGELGINDGVVLSINHTDMIFSGYDSFNVPRHYYGLASYYRTEVDSTLMTPLIEKYWDGLPSGSLTSFNSCALAIDFIPYNDSIALDFVFTDASMDITEGTDPRILVFGIGIVTSFMPFRHNRGSGSAFNEFTLSPRCDIIGMFLHKKNSLSDTLNLAVYPDEDIPVNYYSLMVDTPYVFNRGKDHFFEPFPHIDTVYPGSRVWWSPVQSGNRSYYVRPNVNGSIVPDLNYGMFTYPIPSKAKVNPCDTFRFTISIATTYYSSVFRDFVGSALFVSSINSFGASDPTDCNPTSNDLLGRFEHVIIYPNPATDQVTISGLPHNTQVSLADVMGRSLTEVQSQGSSTTIHTADYPAGVYFLQFRDDAGHTGQAKFVIGE